MKKILAPTDFSSISRNAEEYAVSLAKVLNMEVQLLHVYREILPVTLGPEPWTVTLSNVRTEKEKLIKKEIEYLKKNYAVDVTAEVQIGFNSQTIVSFAREIDAELIVMGMPAVKSGLFSGSTLVRTIQKTKTHVLVIPEKIKFAAIKNIVLAVDFSEVVAGECLATLYEIYKKFDSNIHVLHIEEKAAEPKISEVQGKLQLGVALSRFNYQYEKVESDDVEEGIQKFLERHPTDLMVLIAHRHTTYERMFEKIYTNSLIRRLELPLFVVSQ